MRSSTALAGMHNLTRAGRLFIAYLPVHNFGADKKSLCELFLSSCKSTKPGSRRKWIAVMRLRSLSRIRGTRMIPGASRISILWRKNQGICAAARPRANRQLMHIPITSCRLPARNRLGRRKGPSLHEPSDRITPSSPGSRINVSIAV